MHVEIVEFKLVHWYNYVSLSVARFSHVVGGRGGVLSHAVYQDDVYFLIKSCM